MKVLFILFEGLPDTVIDSQVIQYVRFMVEEFGLEFEIYAFCPTWRIYKSSRAKRKKSEIAANCKIWIYPGFRAAMPLASIVNAAIIRLVTYTSLVPETIIHARTDYAAACVSFAELSAPIIWDCRGDGVAESGAGKSSSSMVGRFLASVRARNARMFRSRAAKHSAGAFFVSSPLASKSAALMRGKPYEIVPCAASDQLFFFDSELRNKTRRELKVDISDYVFIYSGTIEKYQCFEETLLHYRKVKKKYRGAKLIILTPNQGGACKIIEMLDIKECVVLSVNLEMVNRYLNAADFAYLLRRKSELNDSASPTKFAEYCMTGLPIIMDESPIDAATIADEFGIRLPSIQESYTPVSDEEREIAGAKACNRLSRRAVAQRQVDLYKLINAAALRKPF